MWFASIFQQVKVDDPEFRRRLFLNKAISGGITMHRHNFIDIEKMIFYKVTDIKREISIPFPPL